MSETIKFIADSPVGTYATDDAGTLIAFSRAYTDELVAIVRTTEGSYITAPLSDIEYDGD